MLFAPHALKESVWPRAAARAVRRRVLRRYGKSIFQGDISEVSYGYISEKMDLIPPFEKYILTCEEHSPSCPCNKSYKSQRITNRRHRKRRRASRKVLFETYHAIDPIERKTHLSLRFCKNHGISYSEVSRPHKEKDLLTNMREMCARLLMLLKRRDPVTYRVRYTNVVIPKSREIGTFSRSLSRLIRRTVYPMAGQWAPGNWQPLPRKDPSVEYKDSASEYDSESSLEEDIFKVPRSHIYVSKTHNAFLYFPDD